MSTERRTESRILLAVPVITAWFVLGAVAQPKQLLVLVFLSAAATAVVILGSRRLQLPAERRLPRLPKGQRWVGLAWLGLLIVSEQKFSANRSPLDAASGNVSAEIVAELFVYGLIVVMVIWRWLPARSTASMPRDVRPLFGWVVMCILSTTWSITVLFSFVRGVELLVPLLLAMHSARLIALMGDGGRGLVRAIFRPYLFVLTLAVMTGYVTPWPFDGTRFAWLGAHPLTVAGLLALGIVVLLIAGKPVLGLSLWIRLPLLVLFAYTLVRTQSRTDYVALAFALLTALWFAGRHHVQIRTLGVLYAGVGLATVIALLRGQLFTIGSHGTGYAGATTLDGRTSLWQLSIQQLHSIQNWLIGLGYGSPRVTVYKEASWAGSAHSSPVELLLGIGIIGLVLFLFAVGFLGWNLGSKTRSAHLDPRVQTLGITLFALGFVHGVVSSELVIPNASNAILAFLAALILARPIHRREADGPLVPSLVGVPALQSGSRF